VLLWLCVVVSGERRSRRKMSVYSRIYNLLRSRMISPYEILNPGLEVLLLYILEWRERNGRYPRVLERGNLGFRVGNGEGFEDGKFVTR
jgi:hypothetical protein